MTGDVTAAEFPARRMTARAEAGLIHRLAVARAEKASGHWAGCQCDPCRVRRIDDNRRHTARLVVLHGGRS
ncbi:hypothetical protein [Streptomyces sp. NPDC057580]|uniref:hypothetical protein n=1 Tax=Streptomyces sp. NPDC057580 TaxID=3346173 RepID=UPI0036C3A491